MIDPNELNLPEFDLESYEIAQELGLDDAWEVSVEVAKQDNAEFIPIDEIDLTNP